MKGIEFNNRLSAIKEQIDVLAIEYAAEQNAKMESWLDDAQRILDELDGKRRGMTPFGRLHRMKKIAPKEWAALAEALAKANSSAE